MSRILRPTGYVTSEEGEFDIVGNPFHGTSLTDGEANGRVKVRLVVWVWVVRMRWNASLQLYGDVGLNYQGSGYLIFAGSFLLHTASSVINFLLRGNCFSEFVSLVLYNAAHNPKKTRFPLLFGM